MPLTPEQQARELIDAALAASGWIVQNVEAANIVAGRGVAVREFPLNSGFGYADYMLYVDGQAAGVIEAKKQGATLTGVERQSGKYSKGLPPSLPAHVRPLPFLYESTGAETRFTNCLDPDPRSRRLFHFHRPETLAAWLNPQDQNTASDTVRDADAPYGDRGARRSTLRSRLRKMPAVIEKGLWPAQLVAVQNLEGSLAQDRPRALIQMATGSGKTFTAITAAYRLIKFGGAQRVLFLVDRANLGRQALKEFQQYTTPDDGRKFTELYNVQHLASNKLDPVARVAITTIQRLYSMLRGDPDLDPALEEGSQFDTASGLIKEPVPVDYTPAIPVEFFDMIFIDECHRSIYSLWRQVLEYFDAHLIGLTATPAKQTFGFFNQNLVMEYNHAQAVADKVNVDFDVYRIRTRITGQGSTVEAGPYEVVGKRDRSTRALRWEKLDENLSYGADELDRGVVAQDQIRTVIKTFRDKLYTEIFPGRSDVPKTLIYAKDDSHADDIVQIVREEFGRGNDFCLKITYRTTGEKPENLISAFRNSYNPRIVVTVDMIATGTDIKPLEIVMFMRAVKSRNFFEQMKGRGVRVIDPTDFQAVTKDATAKTHFVIVDCVGACEHELVDSHPLERKRTVSFEKLLDAVAFGTNDPDVYSSIAGRLARMELRLGKPELQSIKQLSGGKTLTELAAPIVAALDPDRQAEEARRANNLPPEVQPSDEQLDKAEQKLLKAAAQPLATNPPLRQRLIDLKRSLEQTLDTVSQDEVLEAGYSEAAKARAKSLVASFRQFIEEHKDEITALQVLYSQPYAKRLKFADIQALADAIQAPPRSWTPEALWRAYETLERSKVRGSGKRLLTDIVSLVRFSLQKESELVPFPDRVAERFTVWMAQQESLGRRFTAEQRQWQELIRDHIAASLRIEIDDFDFTPFAQRGGAGKAVQVFGQDLDKLLDELNRELVA